MFNPLEELHTRFDQALGTIRQQLGKHYLPLFMHEQIQTLVR